MKASTTIVANSIARAPVRIVSAPSWGLIFCSLIGSTGGVEREVDARLQVAVVAR